MSITFHRLLIGGILSLVVLAGAGFQTLHASRLPVNWQITTATAYTQRVDTLDPDTTVSRLSTVLERIDTIRMRSIDPSLLEFLDFINQIVVTDLSRITEQNQQPTTPQTPAPQQQEPEPELETNETLVGFTSGFQAFNNLFTAGTKAQTIGLYDIVAVREPITIQEITFEANRDISNHIQTLYLVDEQGKIVAQESPIVGSSGKFRNIDLRVEQTDPIRLYLVADFFPVGFGRATQEGVSFTYSLSTTDATGVFSSAKINQSSQQSEAIIIAPIRISSLETVDNAFGYNAETRLRSGTNPIMILQIEADSSTNQQLSQPRAAELLLDSIEFTVADNTTQGGAINTLTIQRIDRASSPISPSSISSNRALFSTIPLTDATVTQGSTATFLVSIDATLDPNVSGEAIQVSITSPLNGGITRKEASGSITYTKLGNHLNQTITAKLSE